MNPLSTVRLVSNIAIVGVIAAFLWQLLIIGPPVSNNWGWIIGGVAFGGGLLQFVMSFLFPKSIASAYDELNQAANAASYVWGYWITLGIYLVLLVLVLSDGVHPMLAFGLIGAPLAAAPALYLALAHLRGRAG